MVGAGLGGTAEFVSQQFSNDGTGIGPGPALGGLAGFAAGGSRGGRFGGALGGAASSAFAGTEPNASSEFRDTAAGGLGGLLGGIGGEFFNTGRSFNLFRGGFLGGFAGALGGIASDATRGLLTQFAQCEEESCD